MTGQPETPELEQLCPCDERRLTVALRAAYQPASLSSQLNEYLVQQALESPVPVVGAVSSGVPPGQDPLARALRAAYKAGHLAPRFNEHLVAQALVDPDTPESLLDHDKTLDSLAHALHAAFAPDPLAPELNTLLVEFALEDPLAPASMAEEQESQRLRAALAGEGRHELQELAQVLNMATRARRPGPSLALVPAAPQTASKKANNLIRIVFGAAAIATLAAGTLLLFTAQGRQPEDPSLALSRSTTTLFTARYELGRTTARVDRIADSRWRDLRQNRYAAWGVE